MRNTSILNLVFGYLILLAWNSNKPVYSSARILNCTGSIPKKTACIIKASSYDMNIRRIDICQKNPLPNYKITPVFVQNYWSLMGINSKEDLDIILSRKYNV